MCGMRAPFWAIVLSKFSQIPGLSPHAHQILEIWNWASGPDPSGDDTDHEDITINKASAAAKKIWFADFREAKSDFITDLTLLHFLDLLSDC